MTSHFQASFNQLLDKLIRSITKDSEKLCWGRLSFLDKQRVQRKISLKAYQHVSGYDEYMADVEWVVDEYKKAIGLGPKVRNCKQNIRTTLFYKQTPCLSKSNTLGLMSGETETAVIHKNTLVIFFPQNLHFVTMHCHGENKF